MCNMLKDKFKDKIQTLMSTRGYIYENSELCNIMSFIT